MKNNYINHKSVLNSIPIPFIVVSSKLIIIYVNNSAETFFGLSKPFLLGKSFDQIVAKDSSIISMIKGIFISKNSIRENPFEIYIPKIGKKIIDLHISKSEEKDKNAFIFLDEVSLSIKVKNKLLHQDSLLSINGVSSLLKHEIKNPLSGIRGAAQILENEVSGSDKELAIIIQKESDRIVNIVNRVELFTDDIDVSFLSLNIHQVLDYVQSIVKAGFSNNIEFVKSYDPSLPQIRGNKDRLIQLFLNLIKNSSEALDFKGKIEIRTSFIHDFKISIANTDNELNRLLPLQIEIIDNGIGVPESIKKKIFDPFVTSKIGGTGLGLSLASKVVSEHGGIIECDSKNSLTIFRINLPIVQE
ncbi:ATP-binding protein [Alphaproteobacteria bacterium]|nr:ATP-binding protein [Alphaproteobacteria bacterium]